jgi:hypothetical protein
MLTYHTARIFAIIYVIFVALLFRADYKFQASSSRKQNRKTTDFSPLFVINCPKTHVSQIPNQDPSDHLPVIH